jgi:hypothetical protein
MYRATNDTVYQQLSVSSLESALEWWNKYVETALIQNNNPIWMNRVGIIDWKQLTKGVEKDIEIAKVRL